MKRTLSPKAVDTQPTYIILNTIWTEKQIWFVKQFPMRTHEQEELFNILYCFVCSVILTYQVVL